MHTFTNRLNRSPALVGLLVLFTISWLPEFGFAQNNVTTYATGLNGPIGLEVDDRGWLWVAEHGSANNDSRISIVTSDGQTHPFMINLPSELNATGEVTGSNHVYFDDSGNLLVVQGEGTDNISASILLVDTTGFTPGDTPLEESDIDSVIDIGTFVFDQGFAGSNPYTLAFDSNGDLFVVDAAANAIIRRDASSGNLSVFATFDQVTNPTGIGNSMVDAVPTGIVFTGTDFYVGSLTGFPFAAGVANVYEVDLNGNVSVFQDELTTIVDIDTDPTDGQLVALQFAEFKPPPPFVPNSGGVIKMTESGLDTLAYGFNMSAGMRFDADGNLFVSSLADGEILKVDLVTSVEDGSPSETPQTFRLRQNYPNPFNPETRIQYELPKTSRVVIEIFNIRGQSVRTLIDSLQPAGLHSVIWNGTDDSGADVPSGIYLYRLTTNEFVQTRKLTLLR